MRKEEVVFSRRFRIALAKAVVRGDSTFKRVRNAQMKPVGATLEPQSIPPGRKSKKELAEMRRDAGRSQLDV